MTNMRSQKDGNADGFYEVSEILGEKIYRSDNGHDITHYKVRWKGYSADYDTWEPRSNLVACSRALEQWHERRQRVQDVTRKRRSAAPNLTSNPKRARGSTESTASLSESPVPDDTPTSLSDLSMHLKIRSVNYPTPKLAHRKLAHPDSLKFQEKLNKLKGPPVTLVNDVDETPCPPLTFQFIDQLKLSPDVPQNQSEFSWGCNCPVEGCKDVESCQCHKEINLKKFTYARGRVIRDSTYIIIECNDHCNCASSCRNRVVQNGRKLPFEIFKTEKKGWGLRCPKMIKKGTFIDLYLGEVIGPKEAAHRATVGDREGLSYLFDLDKFDDVKESDKEIFTIDGQFCGGITRFINHSCDPNVDIYAVTWARRDFSVYDLALFTVRDILPYEELCFSYVHQNSEKKNEGGEIDEKVGKEKKVDEDGVPAAEDRKWPCYCGSKNCRGFLW